jgi:hypothetical protein
MVFCRCRLLTFNAESGLFLVRAIPKICFELGATFVERDGMPKGPYDGVGSGEWEATRYESN